jgi:threonine/homoserine/homoserine lactone efflux protein
MATAFMAGLVLGAFVAAQVGPVSLLCVRTSTRAGFRPGAAVGLGAATVDALYALCGVAGAAALVQIGSVQLVLGLAGAVVLAVMGWRTLQTAWRLRNGGETDDEVTIPTAAFRTGVVATASNPLTIISWAAIFGAASTGELAEGTASAVAMLVGVALGSAGWFVTLAAVSSRAGRRLGPRALAGIDAVAGVGLLAFASLLGVRTVRDL